MKAGSTPSNRKAGMAEIFCIRPIRAGGFAWPFLAAILCNGGVLAQGSKAGPRQDGAAGSPNARQVLERLEQERQQEDSSLTPEEWANLIDKGKIAEETLQRAVGLREAGNPHIPEGILLRQIQEDPTKSQVDLDELRRERIRLVEERRPSLPKLAPRRPSRVTGKGTRGAELNPTPRQSARIRASHIVGALAVALSLAAVLALHYKSPGP